MLMYHLNNQKEILYEYVYFKIYSTRAIDISIIDRVLEKIFTNEIQGIYIYAGTEDYDLSNGD